jgi:hypothetical protein
MLEELSQPPVLLFPFHKTELFKGRALNALTRNVMSDVEKKEFMGVHIWVYCMEGKEI